MAKHIIFCLHLSSKLGGKKGIFLKLTRHDICESYNRRPEDLPEEIVTTVVTITEITGKSISTLFNGLSLLKLSDEIRAAIWAGNLHVSQGYLFAANLECPDLMKAVDSGLK